MVGIVPIMTYEPYIEPEEEDLVEDVDEITGEVVDENNNTRLLKTLLDELGRPVEDIEDLEEIEDDPEVVEEITTTKKEDVEDNYDIEEVENIEDWKVEEDEFEPVPEDEEDE